MAKTQSIEFLQAHPSPPPRRIMTFHEKRMHVKRLKIEHSKLLRRLSLETTMLEQLTNHYLSQRQTIYHQRGLLLGELSSLQQQYTKLNQKVKKSTDIQSILFENSRLKEQIRSREEQLLMLTDRLQIQHQASLAAGFQSSQQFPSNIDDIDPLLLSESDHKPDAHSSPNTDQQDNFEQILQSAQTPAAPKLFFVDTDSLEDDPHQPLYGTESKPPFLPPNMKIPQLTPLEGEKFSLNALQHSQDHTDSNVEEFSHFPLDFNNQNHHDFLTNPSSSSEVYETPHQMASNLSNNNFDPFQARNPAPQQSQHGHNPTRSAPSHNSFYSHSAGPYDSKSFTFDESSDDCIAEDHKDLSHNPKKK